MHNGGVSCRHRRKREKWALTKFILMVNPIRCHEKEKKVNEDTKYIFIQLAREGKD